MKIRNSLKYALVFGLSFGGCDRKFERIVELSDLLNERAIVIERVHKPAHYETVLVPVIDFDLDISFKFKNVYVSDKYKIVFSGVDSHINFVEEGSEQRFKELWERFSEKDIVKVNFRKKYLSLYDCTKAEKELSKREVTSYELVDVVKINE